MISDHERQAGQEATIDSIDQGLARILIGAEASMEIVPVNRLPSGTVGGDNVMVYMPESGKIEEATFSPAPQATEERHERIAGSLDERRNRDY